MKINFKDFWPGQHMFAASLANIESQVEAANRWIQEARAVKILNVETLFSSNPIGPIGSSVVSNAAGRGAHGVRVWFLSDV